MLTQMPDCGYSYTLQTSGAPSLTTTVSLAGLNLNDISVTIYTTDTTQASVSLILVTATIDPTIY
jgi:hypothetical protein